MTFFRTTCLLSLLILAGCKPANTRATTEFSVRSSGAYTETLGGLALFAPTLSDQGRIFSIQLQSNRETPYVLTTFDWGSDARPAPGTYPVVGSLAEAIAQPGTVFVHYTRSQQSPYFYEAFRPGTGTVTLRTSGDSRIEGSLDVTLNDAGRTLQLTGTFKAIPGR